MTDVLSWHPRPPSAAGIRPGTASNRAATPAGDSAGCRSQTVRNFDLTPKDTPNAPKPRKTRGRTPKADAACAGKENLPMMERPSPLFATLMRDSVSARLQRPDSALSSPAFDSPSVPDDGLSFTAAFKDLAITPSSRLPPVPAAAAAAETDFGEAVGVARRARLAALQAGDSAAEPEQAAAPPAVQEDEGAAAGAEDGAWHAQAAVQWAPSTPAEQPEAAAPATVGGRPVSRALFAGAAEGAAQIDSPHVPRPPPPRPDSAARR